MLRSDNFIIRPFVPSDAPDFVNAVVESALSVGRWMPWAHNAYSMAEAMSWIAHCAQGWEERSSFEFGIFDAASGSFAGGCGLNQFNPIHGYCNLGYWVRDSCQRRGAATDAVCALSRFAFAELPLGRIEIAVGVGNVASLGAARKAGAVDEGIARKRLRFGPGYIDAHILSILPPTI